MRRGKLSTFVISAVAMTVVVFNNSTQIIETMYKSGFDVYFFLSFLFILFTSVWYLYVNNDKKFRIKK